MVKHRIVIEVREDDKVYVTGPLDNKQLCIAMLEEAKETVNNWKKTKIAMPTINNVFKKINK
jgi:hypothetical protein